MRWIATILLFWACNEPAKNTKPVLAPEPAPAVVSWKTLPSGTIESDTVLLIGNFKADSSIEGKAYLTIRNAKFIRISGTFDGNNAKVSELVHIEGQGGKLVIDSLRFENCHKSGMGVFATDIKQLGFDTIAIGSYIERDGIGCGDVQGDEEIYGLHIRGGHRVIMVGTIDIEKKNTHWLRQDTLPHCYQLAITCEVDANNFPRPELVFIDSVKVKYFGGLALNGVTNFRINAIVKDSLFWFNQNTFKAINLTKFGYSNYRVDNSRCSVGSVAITNSNPAYQLTGFVIPFFIADEMGQMQIDSIDSDMICILQGASIKSATFNVPLQDGSSEWLQFHSNVIEHLTLGPNHTIYTLIAKSSYVGEVKGNTNTLVK